MIDDFWTHDIFLFSGTFPRYKNQPRPVRANIHVSDEPYRLNEFEHDTRPVPTLKGTRSYVMLHPYVLEPILTITIGLYNKPKQYADQGPAIGETLEGPRREGVREFEIGSAQAWYYHEDRIIEIWECFLWEEFRKHPFIDDPHMKRLWQAFENWLVGQFPEAQRIITPFNDPIAETVYEYQAFLRSRGFGSVAKSAFGKPIARGELPHKGG